MRNGQAGASCGRSALSQSVTCRVLKGLCCLERRQHRGARNEKNSRRSPAYRGRHPTGEKFPDVTARSTYPVDIHTEGSGTRPKGLPPGEAHDIRLPACCRAMWKTFSSPADVLPVRTRLIRSYRRCQYPWQRVRPRGRRRAAACLGISAGGAGVGGRDELTRQGANLGGTEGLLDFRYQLALLLCRQIFS